MNGLSDVLESLVKQGLAAGAAVSVTADGRELYRGCRGYADLEKRTPFAEDTICRVYSMTKVVTAVAAMILLERGKYRLEDPVKVYLPAFRELQVMQPAADGGVAARPAQETLRIRHLLTMRAGLPYFAQIGDPKACESYNRSLYALSQRMRGDTAAGAPWDLQRFAAELAGLPMFYEPGTGWTYGFSADILGAVLERISGKSLGEFFREEIFEPLGMEDTGFTVPAEKQGRLAVLYDHTGPEPKPFVNRWVPTANTPGLQSAGEGLYSTLIDYSRFLQMLAGGGTSPEGVRILGRKTVEAMRQNHVPTDVLAASGAHYFADGDYGYGYLVGVKTNNTVEQWYETPGTFWWGGVSGTIAKVDPSERMTVTVMLQHHSAPQERYVGRIMQAAYALL